MGSGWHSARPRRFEGTQGIITEATLRLQPPPHRATTLVASFPMFVAAGAVVTVSMADTRPLQVAIRAAPDPLGSLNPGKRR
jgi:hypothetical protein